MVKINFSIFTQNTDITPKLKLKEINVYKTLIGNYYLLHNLSLCGEDLISGAYQPFPIRLPTYNNL